MELKIRIYMALAYINATELHNKSSKTIPSVDIKNIIQILLLIIFFIQ